MKTIDEYLEEQINEQLCQAILSSSRGDGPSKVKIRPVEIRGKVVYQASETVGTKVLHKNYSREELISYLKAGLQHDFSQLQASGMALDGTILVSKKGKMTIKTRRHPENGKGLAFGKDKTFSKGTQILAHNRVKQYILKENIPVPFLVDLGVMNKEGRIITQKYDKFRQINRFLEFIQDILPRLDQQREVTILDFGCGKSYLTFAMYYYLRELKGYDVNIIGLDLKTDVIEKCNHLAVKYGYEKLHFYQGDIADYEGVSSVDMVVTLHACDTATDYALYNAIKWNTKMIFSVPCCQHELNAQMKSEDLSILTNYGIIQERVAALMTDAIRANLLESVGYKTQLLEFIDIAHSPKNILVRSVKSNISKEKREKALKEVDNLVKEFNFDQTLYRLLKEDGLI